MTNFTENTYLIGTSQFKSPLITKAQYRKLVNNRYKTIALFTHSGKFTDFKPVVKLVTREGKCVCLLSELGSDLIAYGLIDLGEGDHEFRDIRLWDLHEMGVKPDKEFVANKSISQYVTEAKRQGRIIA